MASVVFMGTPDFAAGILRSLIGSGHEVKAVFTQPDRPKGRRGELQMPPVKALALENGIAVYQPEKIRFPENVQLIENIKPDFIVAAAFGQIIPQAILDIPQYGCLNVHASLLPRWRGAAPIQWSILSGDRVTGVTIMRMNAGLDTGDMILKEEIPILDDETGESLFEKLMHSGEKLLPEAMEQILAGSAVYTEQPAESPTPYARMLTRQSGLIDWHESAASIERLVRAMYSWPGTFSYLNGKMLKILRSGVAEPDMEKELMSAISAEHGAARPGEIVRAQKDDFIVQTGNGLLKLLEVQPEGKKRMAADAFLRGYHLKEGDVLSEERQV